MPLRATTMMAARMALGSSSKSAPMERTTTTRRHMETAEVTRVRPPTPTWTMVRDMDAEAGRQRKNDAATLARP